MNAVIAVIVPFAENKLKGNFLSLKEDEVKNTATKMFVRIVKKLKNRIIVSGISACRFSNIKKNCAIMANHPMLNPTISNFLFNFFKFCLGFSALR